MPEKISFCGSCGSQIEGDAKFCSSCGAAIPPPPQPVQQSAPRPVQQPAPQPVQQPVPRQVQQPAPQPVQYAAPQYQQPQYAQPVYAVPAYAAPAYAGAAMNKPKKKKGLGCLLAAVISLLLVTTLIVTGFIWPAFVPLIIRSLTPVPDYITKGYTDSVSASGSSKATIGDIKKDGVQLDIAPGAFKDGSKVEMNVLPKDDIKEYEKPGYNILSSVISLKAENYDEELFAEPVVLTLDLPVAQMDRNSGKCDYFVGYYNEKTKEWQLYEPDWVDVDKGRAQVSVMHFSHLAIIDPEENETVEKYLKDYCAEKARQETLEEEGREAFQPYAKAIADKMAATQEAKEAMCEALIGKFVSGINTDTKKGKIVSGALDFSNTVGWGAYRAVKNGDSQEFKDAMKTATVKALGSYMSDDGNFVNFLGSAGTIGTMAGQIQGGDYTGAIQSAEDIALNFFPTANAVDKAAKYVVRKVDMDYTMWKKDRIDDLYVKWRNGFSTSSMDYKARDFDDLLLYMDYDTHANKSGMGNADMMLKRIYDSDQKVDEQVQRYGFGNRTYKSLSDDEKAQFANRVTNGLKEYFEQRYKNETKAKAMEQEEISFVNDLYRWGYLKENSHLNFFRDNEKDQDGKKKYSIADRIRRLQNVRGTISEWVDPAKMEKTYTDYSYLLSEWVNYHDEMSPTEARHKFMQFLKEKGVLKDGINVPDLDEVTVDDIVGTWDVDASFSDVDSPFLDLILQGIKDLFTSIAEELGGSADDVKIDDYKDQVATVSQTIKIKKLSADRVSVTITTDGENGGTYEGTLKNGVLSLKLTKSASSGDDAIVLDIQNLEYKFYKTNGYVRMDGSYEIKSLAFSATYSYNGYKTS